MHAFNEFFDAVYVLNLASRPERWAAMADRLQGISYTRHEAIPGAVTRHYHALIKDSRPFGNPNYVACTMSHLHMFATSLARGHKSLLILEDDVGLHRDSDALTRQFMAQVRDLTPTWDLLYLSYIPLTPDCSMWSYVELDRHVASQNVRLARNLWSLMGYAISDRLMRHVLQVYGSSMPMELDRFFVTSIQPSAEFKCYGASPQIIAGHDGFSDNAQRNETGLVAKSMDSRLSTPSDYGF